MSTPLNSRAQSNAGAYGTHSGSNNSGNTRQRRNPADYGLFSSPHGSIDDSTTFPPYAELPFTSLKRRRQLQDNNSFVKWAMRAVLLSPVVVLVLWSVAAIMFANTHQVGQSNKSNINNSSNNNNNNSFRRQSQRNRRMLPNYFGNSPNAAVLAGISQQQQLQDQQGNLIYNVNGNAMVMAPQQAQQQLQGMSDGQLVTNNLKISNGYQQQQQVEAVAMQTQGEPIPVLASLGNGRNPNIIPSNNLLQGQQQVLQQVPQQQVLQQVPQQQVLQQVPQQQVLQQVPQQQVLQQVPQQQVLQQAGAVIAAQPQQGLMATNGVGAVQTSDMTQQQMPQVNLYSSDANVMKQPSMTDSVASEQIQQLPLDGLKNNNIVQASAAMQQVSGLSGATQDELHASPAKQAIYFYDPNDTTMSQAGDVLQMPVLVYDVNGKAVPLVELQHKAPIYVQAPVRGATTSGTINSDTDTSNVLLSPSSRGASLLSPSSREASIPMPQSWGASSSQDQRIIIATVAVMALLVGALSARRMRSKSFLASCIENETLEDDVAYDDAYTTTAAASGAMGADSSYNTFGGWKGDLEKFDV